MSSVRAGSGSPFEQTIEFCRALRVGDRVLVAGTAPIRPDGSCADDPAKQARRCLAIISDALATVGACMADVVRTRMFITSVDCAPAVGEVHGEVFAHHPPVATMVVVAGLLDPRWRVEVEVEAVIQDERPPSR